MSLSQLYQERLLAHNRAPNNRFELPGATHRARGTDALCGDDIELWLRLAGDRVEAASWSGEACAVTTAAASMLTEWLQGRRPGAVQAGFDRFGDLIADADAPDDPELGDLNVLRAVSAFPSRRRNALLPWKTALEALASQA
jgi:nitrogen fixation NifU-like protein